MDSLIPGAALLAAPALGLHLMTRDLRLLAHGTHGYLPVMPAQCENLAGRRHSYSPHTSATVVSRPPEETDCSSVRQAAASSRLRFRSRTSVV